MTSTVQTRMTAFGGVLLLSLAVFALAVSTAQAAANLTPLRGGAGASYAAANLTPLRGGAGATYAAAGTAPRALSFGRGGVFVKTAPVAASTAALIGGIAVTALVVALIAFSALGRRASRRGELAPVTSLVQTPSASPETQYEDRERKAA